MRCRNSHTEGIASAPIADTDPVGVQSQQPKVRPSFWERDSNGLGFLDKLGQQQNAGVDLCKLIVL